MARRVQPRVQPQRNLNSTLRQQAAKAAADAVRPYKRSRPGLLRAAEVTAKAQSQWAAMESADVKAAAAEIAAANQVQATCSKSSFHR